MGDGIGSFFILAILYFLVFGGMGYAIYKDEGAMWGILLGPVGLIIAAILSCRKDYTENKPSHQPHPQQKPIFNKYVTWGVLFGGLGLIIFNNVIWGVLFGGLGLIIAYLDGVIIKRIKASEKDTFNKENHAMMDKQKQIYYNKLKDCHRENEETMRRQSEASFKRQKAADRAKLKADLKRNLVPIVMWSALILSLILVPLVLWELFKICS